MRHRKLSQRLSRPPGHRRATLRNLNLALLKHQRIKTTRAKARFVQPLFERLIILGKQNTLHSRRQALKILDDKKAVNELFARIAPLFKERPSGFSRIMRLATRRSGDGAEMVLLELTEKLAKAAKTKAKAAPKQKPEAEKEKPKTEEKPRAEARPEEKLKTPKEKARPFKELKPKKFLGGLRRLFKKERDAL